MQSGRSALEWRPPPQRTKAHPSQFAIPRAAKNREKNTMAPAASETRAAQEHAAPEAAQGSPEDNSGRLQVFVRVVSGAIRTLRFPPGPRWWTSGKRSKAGRVCPLNSRSYSMPRGSLRMAEPLQRPA